MSSRLELTVIQEYSKLYYMKATLDIPEELYRKVKAKSAMEGRPVREVTMSLYEDWLSGARPTGSKGMDKKSVQWLNTLLKHRVVERKQGGPTARQLLEGDRNRLDVTRDNH